MKSPPCQFCQRLCRKVAPDKSQYGSINFRMGYWQCDYHGSTMVKFTYGSPPAIWHTTILGFFYHDATYQAYFYYDNDNIDMNEKFVVYKMDAKQVNAVDNRVFSLDFYPDITPENIQKKCSLLMVFS